MFDRILHFACHSVMSGCDIPVSPAFVICLAAMPATGPAAWGVVMSAGEELHVRCDCRIFSWISIFFLIFTVSLAGCSAKSVKDNVKNAITPSDTKIMKYHVKQDLVDIEDLMNRLYLKNPIYEPGMEQRMRKLDAVFRHGIVNECDYFYLPSNELLTMAFSSDCPCHDRIFILGLGLARSIREAYDVGDMSFMTGVQVTPERLQRLYHNLEQTNWRLKTYRDERGELLFRTNETGESGYINMEYEKIFTRMLIRTGDDIYLRDGLMNNFLFRSTTVFLSILTL